MPFVVNEIKRCVVSGAGHRAHSWVDAISTTYRSRAQLVGLCDSVLERCHDMNHSHGASAAVFGDYERMLAECRPDLVIITSPDHCHADQIIMALDAGCEVASEKPLCTTMADARRILAAQRRNGREIFMGFNYRFIPLIAAIRRLLLEGAIGRPVSIDLTWYLDHRGHGVSYFRRWHRQMRNSGGLLITKGTHHLDLANWWMDDVPQTVFARCRQNHFGPGHNPFQGKRCRDCAHANRCQWYTDACVREPDYDRLSRELGYQVHAVRNYERDYCPFAADVDIYDTMALVVEYKNGGVLNYSLNAGAPFEGWNLAINGTGGRLESKITDGKPAATWVTADQLRQVKGTTVEWPAEYGILVMPHQRPAFEVKVPNIAEGHGGGDFKMFDALFLHKGYDDDPLGQLAGARAGAYSVAIGDAANQSAACGRPIMIDILNPPSMSPKRPITRTVSASA